MHERMIRVDTIDLETGRFPMVLATEGEASDGDILGMAGGEAPPQVPLQLSHANDPTFTLGSATEPQKELKASPPLLRYQGQIELDGEGATADIRRDIALMIDKGHVNRVSVRWEPLSTPVRRVNLPSDHPHFVDGEKETGPKRWGVFYDKWRVLEASVVAVPADQAAVIGRAEQTTGTVSKFWRALAEEIDDRPVALASFRVAVNEAREHGLEGADLRDALYEVIPELIEDAREARHDLLDEDDLDLSSVLDEDAEPAADEASTADPERVEPAGPTPEPQPSAAPIMQLDAGQLRKPLDMHQLAGLIAQVIERSDERHRRNVQLLLDQAMGKVSP